MNTSMSCHSLLQWTTLSLDSHSNGFLANVSVSQARTYSPKHFSNTFHFLFLKKMWIIRAVLQKMFVRIANSEDPDQTASEEAVWSRPSLFVQAFFTGNKCSFRMFILFMNITEMVIHSFIEFVFSFYLMPQWMVGCAKLFPQVWYP